MNSTPRVVHPPLTRWSRVEPLNRRGGPYYVLAALGGGLAVAWLAVVLVWGMYWVAP